MMMTAAAKSAAAVMYSMGLDDRRSELPIPAPPMHDGVSPQGSAPSSILPWALGPKPCALDHSALSPGPWALALSPQSGAAGSAERQLELRWARMADPLRIASRRRCLPLSRGCRLVYCRIAARSEKLNGLVVEVQRVDWRASRLRSKTRDRVCLLSNAPWQYASERMLEKAPDLPALASEERSTEHIQVCEQADSAVYPGIKIQTLP
jgi:hypothetical protein